MAQSTHNRNEAQSDGYGWAATVGRVTHVDGGGVGVCMSAWQGGDATVGTAGSAIGNRRSSRLHRRGVRDVTTAWIGSGWVESGIGELNPCHQLGKLGHGRYTNPASNRHQHFSRIAAHDKSDRHCLGEIGVVPRPSDLQPGDQRGKGCIS